MSKENSGLFSGTNGSVNNVIHEEQSHSKDTYNATEKLKNHIENSEPTSNGNNGIKGAHHKENFLKEVDRIGAKMTQSVPSTQLDGVETIFYKMPKKDKSGNPIGDYKAKSFKKTVYDPSIISTETYIKYGLQAANNAANLLNSGKLGREWTGTDNQGVKWHGYCNSSDEITSFYPED